VSGVAVMHEINRTELICAIMFARGQRMSADEYVVATF